MTVILGHIQKAPPVPRKLNPAIPQELEAIILRCLTRARKKRFQQISELLEALDQLRRQRSRRLAP